MTKSMSKKFVLAFVIIALLATMSVAFSACDNVGKNYIGQIHSANQVYEEADVRYLALEIKADYANITIKQYEGQSVKVSYYAENDVLSVDVNSINDGLRIIQRNLQKVGVVDGGEITVEIPESNGTLNSLAVDLSAGKIVVENMQTSTTDINLDAGEVIMNSCGGNVLGAEVNAGSLNVSECQYASVDMNVDAGNIDVKRLVANIVDADVDAGDLTINMLGDESEYGLVGKVDIGERNFANKPAQASGKLVDLSVDVGNINLTFSQD